MTIDSCKVGSHLPAYIFFESCPCLGRHTPTGVLPYAHGGSLFPASLDPLTALHCIRGSVLAGGMVTQGGSIYLYSLVLLGFRFALLNWKQLYIFFVLWLFLSQGQMILFLLFLHPASSVSSDWGTGWKKNLSEYPGDMARTAISPRCSRAH